MPKVTKFASGGQITEFSAEETRRSIQLCSEAEERMRDRLYPTADARHPSIQSVACVVAWSEAYAPADRQFDESHPLWKPFHEVSEWFRLEIARELKLSSETTWEMIYRLSGFLIDAEYDSEEAFWEAHHFGQMTRLKHEEAAQKLEALELLHARIVG